MKTYWPRHDEDTDFLFKCESHLHGNFVQEAPAILKQLKKRFDDLAKSGIATSHGLDRFLQVAMAWITTYLGSKKGQPTFRATVSLYLRNRQAILVKPCLVYPGRCRVPQPTISLAQGFHGRIGHPGVSMFLGEILYCQPGKADCGQYIPLDSFDQTHKTLAALCIPLEGDLASLTATFRAGGKTQIRCMSPRDKSRLNQVLKHSNAHAKPTPRFRWVLNIECLSKDLTKPFAGDILADPAFAAVIKNITQTLAAYEKQRNTHLALERSSTLLALATNTLKPRSAYRALLREISNACDGADVTLHLRDLFDRPNDPANQRNRDRCSVFVTGVGKNFRDFLINVRIGLEDGQIGWALDDRVHSGKKVSNSTLDLPLRGESAPEKVRVQYIVGKEIEDALNYRHDALPYKQLMPKTFLNATVPIHFHDRRIGVINLEWDWEHLEQGFSSLKLTGLSKKAPAAGRKKIEEYLSERLPLVYRMADYLSLVIDYFDDIGHLAPLPSSKQLADVKFVEDITREGALRRVMRYYVGRGMEEAKKLVEKKVSNDEAEKLCLKDLVDAVGYFLASTHNFRILVSVRRKVKEGKQDVLRQHVFHWLEGIDQYEGNRKTDIPIVDGRSVLATSAYRGIPLFGVIKDKKLRLSPLCRELLRDSDQANRLLAVRYSPAGPNPRHEVGVPLVFGKNMLGTFDFEQFEQERTKDSPPDLKRRALCSHLEWGRAISFLIAYLEDARAAPGARPAPFRRFQLLCAQLIAEVPIEDKQFMAIATDAFAEIVPVKKARLEETLPVYNHKNVRNRLIAPLRFRGPGDHGLSWEWDDSSNALLQSKSESEPGKTVTTMMTSYHALIQSLRPQDPGDGKFLTAIKRIMDDLLLEETKIVEKTADAAEYALDIFSFLHTSLSDYLADSAWEPKPLTPRRYAWFLHVSRFDPHTGRQEWVCNPDSKHPDKRLAYCHTEEMEEILRQTKERPENNVVSALSKVLEERAHASRLQSFNRKEFERVIDSIKADMPIEPSDEDLIKAITIRLSRSKSDQGDESDEGKRALGFTQSVAIAGHPIVVPEINLSPNRSERDHGWFWKHTYTVIGIPFILDNKCVAVLNVFRRRNSSSDMDFFRIEERDKAHELAQKVNALFVKLLEIEEFPFISNQTLSSGLLPLSNELLKRASGQKKLIVIRSPFARSRESFNVLYEHLFGDHAQFAELANATRFPDHERSYFKRIAVIRLENNYKDDADKLDKLGQLLKSIADHAKCVFLFASSRRDIALESVPCYARYFSLLSYDESLLQRNIEPEEQLYYRWVLGQVIRRLSTGTRLLAPRNKFSHVSFREWILECGKTHERGDFYSALDHLQKQSRWRPSQETLLVNNWEGIGGQVNE